MQSVPSQVSGSRRLQGGCGAGPARPTGPQQEATGAGLELLPFSPDSRSAAGPRLDPTQPPPAVDLEGYPGLT